MITQLCKFVWIGPNTRTPDVRGSFDAAAATPAAVGGGNGDGGDDDDDDSRAAFTFWQPSRRKARPNIIVHLSTFLLSSQCFVSAPHPQLVSITCVANRAEARAHEYRLFGKFLVSFDFRYAMRSGCCSIFFENS